MGPWRANGGDGLPLQAPGMDDTGNLAPRSSEIGAEAGAG
jgi:hypothetical protein